tara:strand:+ start:2044 stop:2220 length:177 start_codon:yes stop_codon:yes gene_type:complete
MLRPLKNTNALTFEPSSKNFNACFVLKARSCSSVLGPKRISLITVFDAFAFIIFCFFF